VVSGEGLLVIEGWLVGRILAAALVGVLALLSVVGALAWRGGGVLFLRWVFGWREERKKKPPIEERHGLGYPDIFFF
jgi:hypothetical protein